MAGFFRRFFGPNNIRGAGRGALMGAPFGPIGIGIGGAAGGALGDRRLNRILGGGGGGGAEGMHRFNLLNSRQKRLLSKLIGKADRRERYAFDALKQMLRTKGKEFNAPSFKKPKVGFEYDALEAPILERWESQILPSIMERFASGGNKNSSGLQQTLGQAGRGVTRDLASIYGNLLNSQAGMRNQNAWNAINLKNQNFWNKVQMTQNAKVGAMKDLFNMNQNLLNPSYATPYYQQPSPGIFGQLAPGLGAALGNFALNQFAGGGAGGAGGGIGGMFG